MTETTAASSGGPTVQHRNEVLLVGRVTSPANQSTLPSGDVVRSWNLTVDRGDGRFDVVRCTAWTARLQRTVGTWRQGDVVQVEGAVRRRFWRIGGGVASAYNVEVLKARRIAAAPTRPRKPG